jgi:hypothetical protein
MHVQERLISSLNPAEAAETEDKIHRILHHFHSFMLEEGRRAEEAQRVGLRIADPDVHGQVVLPHIASFEATDEGDPVLHLINVAQTLFVMSTNTVLFMAQVIESRNALDGQLAQHLVHFAQLSNENLHRMMQRLFTVSAPTLLNADGSPLH